MVVVEGGAAPLKRKKKKKSSKKIKEEGKSTKNSIRAGRNGHRTESITIKKI